MIKKCHFIGIGGAGMSGLARLMLNKNIQVSGSDIASNTIIDGLASSGAKVHIGHAAANVVSDMTVVYTTDIKHDNPEYQAALRLKCPMLHRSELLQIIMESYQSLTVAGTHGKTTTTSLLTWVLESSGLSPSYAIGGVAPQLAANAGQGTGKYFVAEACESDGSFLKYSPYGSIVTNIDLDHMDHYHTETALIEAFKQFMGQVTSSAHLFYSGDDIRLQHIKPQGISYGFGEHCELRASNFSQQGWKSHFDIAFHGKKYSQIEVALTGQHNALNALGVFGLALTLGIEEDKIRKALSSFGGVLRRCEMKGDKHGILCIDDYAHHPTELRVTLKAIRRAIGERRMVVVYQPHRYSRAKDCMGQYGGIFEEADALFVTEIYAAREKPIPGVSHENIISEIAIDLNRRCSHVERKNVANVLGAFLRPHDVLVTLGAGDVTNVSGEVLRQLSLKAPTKLKVGMIFGGMSVEHEVSLLSADYMRAALRPEYYEVENFGITYQGHWLTGADAREKVKTAVFDADKPKITHEVFNKIAGCDILFPVMHGTNGEDGTIQGFFEMLSKAYVGCDHRSAAISMDKEATKKIVADAGIRIVPHVAFSRYEWDTNKEALMKRIHNELRYPLFVKPIHLGSSIGVHKAVNEDALYKGIADAFRFDTKLMIENGLDIREIEFALLGNDEVVVFPPAEVVTHGQMQGYHAKYGFSGEKAVEAIPKADLPDHLMAEGMEMVKRAYQAVGCVGMARIDTFLDKDGKFWFNEINPIPGCTKHSIYPQICEANGLAPADLVDRLLILGLQRRRQLDRLQVKS